LVLGLSQFSTADPLTQKIDTYFKSGQNRLKNIHLALKSKSLTHSVVPGALKNVIDVRLSRIRACHLDSISNIFSLLTNIITDQFVLCKIYSFLTTIINNYI